MLFVDADDWLPHNAIEILWDKQRESDADFVCGNTVIIKLMRSLPLRLYGDSDFARADTQAFDNFFISQCAAYTPWAHLYKRQTIQAANLTFRTDMISCEDILFNLQYLQYCNRIATTCKTVYYYNGINTNSATKKYVPDGNKDGFLYYVERRKLYTSELTPAQQCKEDDLLLFTFGRCFQDYVYFLQKESAVEKMKETHEMYAPLLVEIGTYDETVPSGQIRAWLTYRRFLDEGDYEGLYDYFNGQKNFRQAGQSHFLVKKVLRSLRMFQLFRLKLGYR